MMYTIVGQDIANIPLEVGVTDRNVINFKRSKNTEAGQYREFRHKVISV